MIESDISAFFDLLENLVMAIAGIITAVSGTIAVYKSKQTKDAKAETQAAQKETEAAKAETEAVQKFFDPTDSTVMTPPAGTPERSWKMAASTREWILHGHEGEELASMAKQIDDAEAAGLVDYTISWDGGYYTISYGMIKTAARWKK